MSFVSPATGSIPYDDVPTSRPRVHNILRMDVRIQEEYLNLYAKYLVETAFQTTLKEVQQERNQWEQDEQEITKLSKQTAVEKS